MKRARTLGLVTTMALTLIALAGAASASAAVFKSESVSTALTAKNVKTTSLSLNGETFSCGEKSNFSMDLKAGSASQLTPHSWTPGCVFGGQEAFWNVSSCFNEINAAAGESMQGTMNISGCEKPLTYERVSPGCRVEIPSQKGLGGIEFVNEGSGTTKTIKLILSITNLTFSREGAGCFGPTGTFSNGTYSGQWSITGSAFGQQVSVWVDQNPKPPTHFAVEGTPAPISGQLLGTAPNGINLANVGGIVTCKKFSVAGQAFTLAPESLVFSPSYGECKSQVWGTPTSISMGGCFYQYHASGKVDIIGTACASNPITIKLSESCTATIGPQNGLSGINYAVAGSGSSRSITSNGQAAGLAVTGTGLCMYQGTSGTGLLGLSSYTLKLTSGLGGLWLE